MQGETAEKNMQQMSGSSFAACKVGAGVLGVEICSMWCDACDSLTASLDSFRNSSTGHRLHQD